MGSSPDTVTMERMNVLALSLGQPLDLYQRRRRSPGQQRATREPDITRAFKPPTCKAMKQDQRRRAGDLQRGVDLLVKGFITSRQ